MGLITLAVGFVVFLAVSSVISTLNIATGIASGLITLAGCAFVALAITGHQWRIVTGVSRISGRDVGLGALLAVANSLSVGGWLSTLTSKIFPQFVLDLFDTSRVLAGAMSNPLEHVIVVVAVVVFAPLAEEFLFRGIFFRGLTQRLSVTWSVVISGVIFSAYHIDPVGFLPRVEIGVLLAVLVWKTGSLWPAIAAHAANNGLAVGLMYVTGEETDAPLPVSLGSFVVLLGCLVWLARRPTAPAPEDPAAPRASVLRTAAPWVGALVLIAASVAVFDWRGVQLTSVDLGAPLIGKGDEAEEDALRALRVSVRRGEGALGEYSTRRKRLSEARLKALFAPLLKGTSKP